MKDELGGGIITEFAALRPKTYSYMTDEFIKSENHEVYTENINKIALGSNDDKRIVALDGIASYPYGYCGED